MPGRGHHHHLLLHHRQHLEVLGHDGQGEQAQVHGVGAHQLQDLLRAARGHVQVHAGVEAAVPLEEAGQDVEADGHASSQVEDAALEGVGLGDLGQGLLHVVLHAVGHAQEQLPRLREAHPLGAAAQEHAPQLLLQELHLAAHRGLGDVEAAGGAGERALFGHGAEHLELAEVHHALLRWARSSACMAQICVGGIGLSRSFYFTHGRPLSILAAWTPSSTTPAAWASWPSWTDPPAPACCPWP